MSEEIITFAVRNKALGPQGLLDKRIIKIKT